MIFYRIATSLIHRCMLPFWDAAAISYAARNETRRRKLCDLLTLALRFFSHTLRHYVFNLFVEIVINLPEFNLNLFVFCKVNFKVQVKISFE